MLKPVQKLSVVSNVLEQCPVLFPPIDVILNSVNVGFPQLIREYKLLPLYLHSAPQNMIEWPTLFDIFTIICAISWNLTCTLGLSGKFTIVVKAFLNGIIHLPLLELSIIIFRETKMRLWKWPANSYTAWSCSILVAKANHIWFQQAMSERLS